MDANGNTHKWNVFVRSGLEGLYLDKLVHKVVIRLHETFENPVRTLSHTPFCVKENGYGEFEFPIEIYFNGTDEVYKLNYFLALPPLNANQPLSRVRREVLQFINPCPVFRQCLIDSGAKSTIDNSLPPLPVTAAAAAATALKTGATSTTTTSTTTVIIKHHHTPNSATTATATATANHSTHSSHSSSSSSSMSISKTPTTSTTPEKKLKSSKKVND